MVVRKRYFFGLISTALGILNSFTCDLIVNKSFVVFYVGQMPQTNPGFNNTPFKFTKYSNAYMLVYIRDSDKDKIICDVDEKDIAEHLRVKCLSLLG